MPATPLPLQQASRLAAQKLADRHTPFIFECWYVAAFSSDIGRQLLGRTILGKPLVFYRTESGQPIALDDRCVHRSFPLSRSRLLGDTIVCGYHGMRYDAHGSCVAIPGENPPTRSLGVRAYPLAERGPVTWIWMGEQAPDFSQIPDLGDWVGAPGWAPTRQGVPIRCSYVALHENLLDLTHLTHLHATTLGTPDYAQTPHRVELKPEQGCFAIMRDVAPTRLPAIWAKPTGLEDVDAARIVRSEFLSPALHIVHVRLYGLDTPEAERPDFLTRTAHFITPETASSTHYMPYSARNFALDDPSITAFMQQQLTEIFEEDRIGLEAVDDMLRRTPEAEHFELSFPTDGVNIAMRRHLKSLAELEAARPCPPQGIQ